jgi:glutathione synthase/RimK-type ligase-like ATP-grasp enzyme
MKVAIYKDGLVKPSEFDKKYKLILDHNNIDCELINVGQENFWKKVQDADAFIYRWTHHDGPTIHSDVILPIVGKYLDIPCFPDLDASWLFNDKIKEYYLLIQSDFPVARSHIFWKKNEAIDWISRRSEFPIVFKLKRGAGSNNVVLVENKEAGLKLIHRMFGKGVLTGKIPSRNSLTYRDSIDINKLYSNLKNRIRYHFNRHDVLDWVPHKNYVYFQDFYPGNKFDTRVTVIGDRAFSFRRYVRKNDFRASGSGNIDYSISDIDMRCIDIAFSISKKFNYRSMAYDFVYDSNNEPLLVEISYTYNDVAIYKCPGYWDEEHGFHEGNYWPQYLHLVDLLKMSGLVQPDMTHV